MFILEKSPHMFKLFFKCRKSSDYWITLVLVPIANSSWQVQWGMSEVLAQREAVMVGLPMARWIDNIRENRSFFHDNCYRLLVQAHRCWCHCHCRERNRGKFHRLSKSDFWEFESFPFTGAAICGHPGLSFPGWVATGTEGRGCHTGRILPLYDQQNMNSNMVTFGIIS